MLFPRFYWSKLCLLNLFTRTHCLPLIDPLYTLLNITFFSFWYLEDLYFFDLEVGLPARKIVLGLLLILDICWLLVVRAKLPKFAYIPSFLVEADVEGIIEAQR